MAQADLSPDGTHIWLDTLLRNKDRAAQIPGSSWKNQHAMWQLPLSWATCVIMREIFKQDLEISEDLTSWATNEVNTRIAPSLALREATDAPGDPSLYPFQRAGVRFLMTAERALLCDGLGAGKSRQAILAMKAIHDRGDNPFPALIVCPNSTKIPWSREIEAVWSGRDIQIIKGTAPQRRKQFESGAEIFIINWEALRGHSRLAPYGSVALKKCRDCGGEDEKITTTKCHVCLKELNFIDFNTVIADEIQHGINAKALQTRSLFAATGDARWRFGLTGTPIADAPDDLWAPMHWLSPEEFPGKVKYRDFFCEQVTNLWGITTVTGLKYQTKEAFFKIIDPRMRRMPKDLVLKHLPPTVYQQRFVEMNPKQAKAYKQMRDHQIAELENGDLLTAATPLTRMIRQLQFASSYAELVEYQETDPDTGEIRTKTRAVLSDPSCKLDAFMEDLPDFGEDSVVVFSPSRQLLELLSGRMEKKEISHSKVFGGMKEDERQVSIDRFQAGKDQFILCTTGAGGTGLTLTKGRIAVFLSRPWSNIDSTQSEGRVHRIGSEVHESILYIDYITTNSVEEKVHDALRDKSDRLEEILRDKDLLKRMLET